MKTPRFDDYMWQQCDPDDLWIYDKLILAKKLGHSCGAPGVSVPKPGKYIVRPITNLLGMGLSARFMHFDQHTDCIKPGNFWCEVFTGRHLSIDYIDGKQVDAVEGFRTVGNPLWKWDKWLRVDIHIPFPTILNTLKDKHYINCEFIDGKLIEVHQRLNQDLTDSNMGTYSEAIPVWKGSESRCLKDQGYTYHIDEDYQRKGFWKK